MYSKKSVFDKRHSHLIIVGVTFERTAVVGAHGSAAKKELAFDERHSHL